MFGKGVRGEVTSDNSALIAPFLRDRAMLRARVVATVKVVRALPEVDPNKVAAIGFCFGGTLRPRPRPIRVGGEECGEFPRPVRQT